MSQSELKVWPTTSKLADERKVLRIRKLTGLHHSIPPKPPLDLFDLTSGDKTEGNNRKMQPLLSTWCESLPKEGVRRVRGIADEDTPAVYLLPVGGIHKIQAPNSSVPLEVHSDPLTDGSEYGSLHSGIQGLYRESGEKKHYKNAKQQLMELCKPSS